MCFFFQGERPWKCRLCTDSFKEPAVLRKHMTSRHDGMPGFSCDDCGELFEFQLKLRNHRKVCEKAQVGVSSIITVVDSKNGK